VDHHPEEGPRPSRTVANVNVLLAGLYTECAEYADAYPTEQGSRDVVDWLVAVLTGLYDCTDPGEALRMAPSLSPCSDPTVPSKPAFERRPRFEVMEKGGRLRSRADVSKKSRRSFPSPLEMLSRHRRLRETDTDLMTPADSPILAKTSRPVIETTDKVETTKP
jgi:hypothetical protein